MKKNVLFIATMLLICLQGFAQQKIYVATRHRLYTVNLENCTSQFIGMTGEEYTDIAVTPNGQLWGIWGSDLYKIDTLGSGYTFVGNTGHWGGNALVELNDSTLIMAVGDRLYRVDVTNASATFIGSTGFNSGGDLTWYDNDLYLVSDQNGFLVKVVLNSTNTAIVSSASVNNPLPYCFGAITVPIASVANVIVGFHEYDAYKICPFDASYQILCYEIVPTALDIIWGAASHRLPAQNPIPISCDSVNSVNEFSKLTFNLSPNPATTELTINFGKAARFTVQLSNTLGEVLEQTQTNSSSLTLNMSIYTRGIYFITVTDEARNKIVRKVVKM